MAAHQRVLGTQVLDTLHRRPQIIDLGLPAVLLIMIFPEFSFATFKKISGTVNNKFKFFLET